MSMDDGVQITEATNRDQAWPYQARPITIVSRWHATLYAFQRGAVEAIGAR